MKKQTQYSYIVSGANGESQGPFSFREMTQFIAEGKITGATVVQRSDSSDWSTAAGFPELGAKDQVVSRYDQEADALTLEMEQAYFRRKVRPGAVWFFWIAALSLPNTLSAFLENSSGFALGLSAVYPIGEAGANLGVQGKWIALAVNLALSALYVFFGIAGWKTKFIPFLLGSAIYAGDTALAVVTEDWISAAIHLLAVASFYSGITAHLDRQEHHSFSRTLAPYAACALIFAASALGVRAWALPPEQVLTPEAWVTQPHKDWPNLVLTHEAEFRNRTGLSGASAFLGELPNGKVVAITAKHLLGMAGGVEPPLPMREVNSSVVHWNLFPRAKKENVLAVKGLFGTAESYIGTFSDTLMLEIDTNTTALAAVPLKLRFKPVATGDRIFIVGVRYSSETRRQEVFPGTVSLAEDKTISVRLEKSADFSGFSGAPMIDADGHVIGVVTGGWGVPNASGEYPGVIAHSVDELRRALRAANALNPIRGNAVKS